MRRGPKEKDMIVFLPGETIVGTYNELAERLGVTRGTLSEAVRRNQDGRFRYNGAFAYIDYLFDYDCEEYGI